MPFVYVYCIIGVSECTHIVVRDFVLTVSSRPITLFTEEHGVHEGLRTNVHLLLK